jgi:hypothetical protein
MPRKKDILSNPEQAKILRYRALWREQYPQSILSVSYPAPETTQQPPSLGEIAMDHLMVRLFHIKETTVRLLYGIIPVGWIESYRLFRDRHLKSSRIQE